MCVEKIHVKYMQVCSYIFTSSGSAMTPLEPSTSLRPHQPVPLPLCRRTLVRWFAAPLQALSLVSTRIGRWWTPESLVILPLSRRGMASSPSAGRQLYRRENDSILIRCLAVGWLARHPLTASPWKDFIAIRCCTVTWLPCHPLDAYCIAVLSPGLRKENPRREKPVGRLFRYPLDIGWTLSHFSNARHSSRQRYPSLSFECMRKFWWSRTMKCSFSFSHGIFAVAAPLTGMWRQRLHRLHTA
jgi:hypothetical protein